MDYLKRPQVEAALSAYPPHARLVLFCAPAGFGKTTKLKRGLRKGGYADKTNEAAIKRMILYK